MNPLMGGGTRLMLALDHRMSDDVDLFIHDAQWIGFLTPRRNGAFEGRLSGYEEDATWVKLKHRHGEIDFIVSGSLLNRKPEWDPTLPFALEPVEEVIAKKLFYRGWTLTARDLFDWKTVSEHPQYRHVPDVLATAVEKLSALPQAAKQWQAIRAADRPALPEAIMWARAELQSLTGLRKFLWVSPFALHDQRTRRSQMNVGSILENANGVSQPDPAGARRIRPRDGIAAPTPATRSRCFLQDVCAAQ